MNRLLGWYPGDGFLWLAANVLLQATVVILSAWALAGSVAHRRAAARHVIWLCALVLVLLSPLTAILMDRAGLETFAIRLPVGSQAETAPPTAMRSTPTSFDAAVVRSYENLPPDIPAITTEHFPQKESQAAGRASTATPATRLSAVGWLQAVALAALGIWSLGVPYLLARLVGRGWALRRLVRSANPVKDERLKVALETIRRWLRLRTLPHVVVWRSEAARITPITAGIFRPVIVLSTILLDTLGEDELRDVLVHECAHVLRHDPLVGFLQRIAGIAFWPYPLVRLMNRELTRAREEVCDNYVLHFTDGPQYAQTLFDLAEKVVPLSPRLAQLGVLQPCWRLEHRVAGLLDTRRNTMIRVNRFTAVTLVAVFLAITLLAAGTKFVRAEPPANLAAAGKPASAPQRPGLAAALTYTCRVTEKGSGKPIAGATVTVRREILAPYERKVLEEPKYQTDAEGKYTFTIPPEQVAERFLYIELDVSHPDYAARRGFGYALSMIRKNETMGERPFFEHVELIPAERISGTVVLPDGKPAAAIEVLGFSMADPRDFESASFTETKTDAEGAFRLNLAKGGDGVFWLLPKDFAPSTHVVLKKRGEMGRFVLEKGITVKGRVLDQHGKPLASVWVNAVVSGGPAKKPYQIPVADMLSRSALTDAKGEFTLAPLPASRYLIRVEKHPHDGLIEDRAIRIPPAVFGPQPLVLKAGETTAWVEVRALAEVVIEGQYYDSQGKPRLGHEPMVWGRMPGRALASPTSFYNTYGKIDTNGKFIIRAPKGLQEAKLDFITNEHSALRVRMKKDGPLMNQTRDISIGTLTNDVRGIEVVRYEAPILVIRPVAPDGSILKNAKLRFEYDKGRSRWADGGRFVEGHDVSYERQTDGRLRSEQLLPDEAFTVTVDAEGYQAKSEKLKLPEGAVKDLEVKLKRR